MFVMLLAASFMLAASTVNAASTATVQLDNSSGTVGFDVTGYAYQLTDGSAYLIVAVIAGANYTAVTSGTGTDAYFTLPISSVSVSSSTLVPVHIGITTDGSTTTTYISTTYYTLNPASIPGQNFFTGIIGPLIIIGVVVGLAGMFIFNRRRS